MTWNIFRATFYFPPSNTLTHCMAAQLRIVNCIRPWNREGRLVRGLLWWNRSLQPKLVTGKRWGKRLAVSGYRKFLLSFCCSSLCFSWKGKKVGLMNQNDIGRQHNQTYNFSELVWERARECMCECERERESACVSVRESERVCERAWESERERVTPHQQKIFLLPLLQNPRQSLNFLAPFLPPSCFKMKEKIFNSYPELRP